MSRSEEVHFVITGEFMTKQARTFWSLEDEPKRAIELLEALHGISQQQILDVLEGRMKLGGDSSTGITLEKDSAEMPTLLSVLSKLKDERDQAREDTADVIQMMNNDVVGVASPRGLIMVPRRQTQRDSRGRRDLRDGLDWKGSVRPNNADDKGEWVEPRFYRETESSMRVQEKRPEREPEPPPAPPKPDEKITRDNGWLSPDGKFYGCSYGGHNQLTSDLDLEYGQTDKENWVKLQARDGEQHFFPHDYDAVAAIQKEMILAFCLDNTIEPPWWVKEEE
jgi:hypothetical protein